jgi:hypothetical protein
VQLSVNLLKCVSPDITPLRNREGSVAGIVTRPQAAVSGV